MKIPLDMLINRDMLFAGYNPLDRKQIEIYWEKRLPMKIEIYTKPNCSYCAHAKEFMKERNIAYTEYKLDIDFNRDLVLSKFPDAKTYPIIVVDDHYIGGFVDLKEKYNPTKLLDSGEWNGA